MTGRTSKTIHSGLLSEFLKASTTFNRLIIFSRRCFEAVFNSLRNKAVSFSKSNRLSKYLMASAPVIALKRFPSSK